MRSKQFHLAVNQGTSRFEICRTISRGVRLMHAPGTRMQDSISRVFGLLHTQAPLAGAKPVAPAAL